MLFNSFEFLFIFCPIVYAGYFLLAHYSPSRIPLVWLTAASFGFYAYWNIYFVPILCISIAFNYIVGIVINKLHAMPGRQGFLLALLWFGIAGNLVALGYFKYADFFINVINKLARTQIPLLQVVLPLGISFFTFTQIAFLVDAYRGNAKEYSLIKYALFVSYFPHLIAGPILHHKEMVPQFGTPESLRISARHISVGLTIFAIGLFKKVAFADGIALIANPVFEAAKIGPIGFGDAWRGALAYTLQIYFDFSGYSDMAIGLSYMLGIRLPVNFYSPYKATNIIEFWRRWHMTLSRFLRDYLYFPLGGNRKGPTLRYVNLMITMLLGGLWHGAGWTFVVWGALHGFYLTVNHCWQAAYKSSLLPRLGSAGINRGLAISLTFLCVVIAWVFFRAPDMVTALNILKAMGTLWPNDNVPSLNTIDYIKLLIIICLSIIALKAPNSLEIMRKFRPSLDSNMPAARSRGLVWAPTSAWGMLTAIVVAVSMLTIFVAGDSTQFLYFQF